MPAAYTAALQLSAGLSRREIYIYSLCEYCRDHARYDMLPRANETRRVKQQSLGSLDVYRNAFTR